MEGTGVFRIVLYSENISNMVDRVSFILFFEILNILERVVKCT
jgi:hypothetical protein